MPFTKPNKGSVLVFSLIVLSIVLSVALSVAVVNVSNRKSAGSTGQSVQSFQVADSGVEMALKAIYKGNNTTLGDLYTSLGKTCNSGGFQPLNLSVSGGSAVVSFYKSNGDPMNTIADCTSATWRDDVAKIKVEGTSAGTTRVIETAIAAAAIRKVPATTNCGAGNALVACTDNNGGGGGGGGMGVCGYPRWNGTTSQYDVETGVWWNNTPAGGVWGGYFPASYVLCQ